LRPDSAGPTYTKGQWKGIHGTVRSSAGGKLTAKTREGARNEIRLGVFYLNDLLFERPKTHRTQRNSMRNWGK
jgi:hypothetical protein